MYLLGVLLLKQLNHINISPVNELRSNTQKYPSSS
jgi:hypothetical protein